MLTIGSVSIGIALLLVILAVIFYIKDDIGRASFWLLAAILAVMVGGSM